MEGFFEQFMNFGKVNYIEPAYFSNMGSTTADSAETFIWILGIRAPRIINLWYCCAKVPVSVCNFAAASNMTAPKVFKPVIT